MLYINSLSPSIVWRDSPEFVTVAHNLDISHPAGSPTYSLSSKLMTLIPIGNIALRVNFFSSISSSLCILLIFTLLYQIFNLNDSKKIILASIIGSLSLIACQSFWNFSILSEVYTFQNFFLLILLFILIKSHTCTTISHLRYKYIFSFLYGLSLGAHAAMAIFLPAFILYEILNNKNFLHVKRLAFIGSIR